MRRLSETLGAPETTRELSAEIQSHLCLRKLYFFESVMTFLELLPAHTI